MGIPSPTICQHDTSLTAARRTTLGLALLAALGVATPAIGDTQAQESSNEPSSEQS